jgi:hypothetical protein
MADEKDVMVGLFIFVFANLDYWICFTIFNWFHQQGIVIGFMSPLYYLTIMALLWRGIGKPKLVFLIFGGYSFLIDSLKLIYNKETL